MLSANHRKPLLSRHHEVQHDEHKHDKADEVVHMIRAWVGQHHSKLSDCASEQLRSAVEAHSLQQKSLVTKYTPIINKHVPFHPTTCSGF